MKILKTATIGLASGLGASFFMNQFQSVLGKLMRRGPETQGVQETRKKVRTSKREGEPATVLAAEAISSGLLHHRLTAGEKKWAGPLMHYVMGGGTALAYGFFRATIPGSLLLRGFLFGSLVWLFADEIAVPGLGLAGKPTDYPLSVHASSLASHWVYGIGTALGAEPLLRKIA